MLKKLVNEAYFTLRITTTGPLLIRSGRATISGPDMAPVLTYRNGQQEVFLPGSSLKGVFRSHVEKVVGSIKPLVACDPFLQDAGNEPRNNRGSASERMRDALTTHRPSCGAYFDKVSKHERIKELPTDRVYRESCPTCRLFGSTSFAGRVAISD